MPRPATISYDDFAAAARELGAGGQSLTFAAVRIKLGGGSYDVLRRYIDRYAEEQPSRQAGPGVPEAVRGGMQALYDQAIAEATRQVRAELDVDAQTLAAERQALQVEQVDMQQRTVQAETEARLLRERVDELAAEREELHDRLDVAQRRVLELEVALASAQGALASERDVRLAQSSAGAVERLELVERFAGDLERAQARFEGLQQHALRQVDEIRTKHVGAVERLLDGHTAGVSQQLASALAVVAKLPQRLIDPSTDTATAGRFDTMAVRIEAAMEASTRKVVEQVHGAARHAAASAVSARSRRADRKAAKGQGTGEGS